MLKHLAASIAGLMVGVCDPVFAQITPDATLGAEASRVTPNVTVRGAAADRIEGGSTRGGNLFHSFSEFNVNAGQRVYFANPDGIRNILGRVTGNDVSDILGTLGVDGNANLFLLNPNGIIFGRNSSLDVRGSFVGTTANRFQFGDQGGFAAADLSAPALLTIDPSALLFSSGTNGSIINRSQIGLQVPVGQSLVLVGNGVSFARGDLNAPGGRIDIAGVAAGQVGLLRVGEGLSLELPRNVTRSDVVLDGSTVNVAAANGGAIAIYANNLAVTNGSLLRGGTESNSGSSSIRAGDIRLNSTGTVRISGESFLVNSVRDNSLGASGNILINAGSLNVTENSIIETPLFGQGQAGNILINAGSLNVTESSAIQTFVSGQGQAGNVLINVQGLTAINAGEVYSTVEPGGTGNAGDIRVTTESLNLLNGGLLSSSSSGQGNAGNVVINARDRVTLSGTNSDRSGSVIFSNVEQTGNGQAGNIRIGTGSLTLLNGAQLVASSRGVGNAGNVTIDARDRVLIDDTGNNIDSSNITTSFQGTGVGQSGDIRIETGTLELNNTAQIESALFSQGTGGNIDIRASGAITISNQSAIISTVEQGAIGNGGSITINTNTLSLRSGGQLSTRIRGTEQLGGIGQGNAGNITINAQGAVEISGKASQIATSTGEGTVGNAGQITIYAGSLSVTDQSDVNSGSLGQGNGGNISLDIQNVTIFDHSNVTSAPTDKTKIGDGGDILLNTGSLTVRNRSTVATSNLAQGRAGTIRINSRNYVRVRDSNIQSINASRSEGEGGNITIHARNLFFGNGALITSSTTGQGNAGNINLRVSDRTVIRGSRQADNPSQILSTVAPEGVGQGGRINLRTNQLILSNGSNINATSNGQGRAGNIRINAHDVSIAGTAINPANLSGIFSNFGDENLLARNGRGGTIIVETDDLSLRDGGVIGGSTFAQGRAGNIVINADRLSIEGTSRSGFSSGLYTISTQSANGRGGNITVDADEIQLDDAAVISAQTFSQRRGGDVTINASTLTATDGGQVITTTENQGRAGRIRLNAETINLAGSDLTYAQRREQRGQYTSMNGNQGVVNQSAASGIYANTNQNSNGQGGNILAHTQSLTIQDSARISVGSLGTGEGGQINLQSGSTLLDRGQITSNTDRSNSGNINIQGNALTLRNRSSISTNAGTSAKPGNGGNININARTLVAIPTENSDITANAFSGNGGAVNITTEGIIGLDATPTNIPASNITASSNQGVQGVVTLNTPDIDPTQGLVELPSIVTDASNQIDQTCSRVRRDSTNNRRTLSEFVVSGRGGLPSSPFDPLVGSEATGQLATLDGESAASESNVIEPSSTAIVEAQGWAIASNGKVMLVTMTPEPNPRGPIVPRTNCHPR